MKRSKLCEKFLKVNGANCCSMKHDTDEGSFSRNGCDCCENGLGTTVYECQGFSPKTKRVVELGDICHECLCYFANGDDSEVES
jgi:hypothetical protein